MPLILVSILPISPSIAAEPIQEIDKTDTVWIVGTDVNGYACWSLSSTKQIPTLQVKVSGKWITKAKGKLSKNSSLCSGSKYPWVVTFHWLVNEIGDTQHPGARSTDIFAREYLPKVGAFKAYSTPAFIKQVYESHADLAADYASAINNVINGITQNNIDSGLNSSSKFAGCMFNGKKLFGRVQLVSSFPDLTAQVVTSFPDLRVQEVTSFPNSCGQWQIVNSFPDITVQLVNSFPDITIQLVNSFPGLS